MTALAVAGCLAVGVAACAPIAAQVDRSEGPDRPERPEGPEGPGQRGGSDGAPLVAAERGDGSTRLVFVAADGRRLADLTPPPEDAAYRVDVQPAWSPDGAWIAFASTRERVGRRRTSLWVVAARPDAIPVRLTTADATDRDPAWSPDGQSLVFASDREGSFDVWRAQLAWSPRPTVRATTRLTTLPQDEVAPDVAPDGTLAFAVIDHRARTSVIWRAKPDGRAPRRLTAGPLDRDPAWSPDGRWLAFAAPGADSGDLDLHLVRRDGTRRARLLDEPVADQRSPAWSRDGRYLFAIAELRASGTGTPYYAAAMVVPITAGAAGEPRLLSDPVVMPRVDLAVGPARIDGASFAANPVFAREAVRDALGDLCLDDDASAPAPLCESLSR